MWALLSSQDHMRLQESKLSHEAGRTVLEVLMGVPLPDDLPRKSCVLYLCSNKMTFVERMPSFDEWGLPPAGLVGPYENPIVVVPFLDAGTELAPCVGAGRACTAGGR